MVEDLGQGLPYVWETVMGGTHAIYHMIRLGLQMSVAIDDVLARCSGEFCLKVTGQACLSTLHLANASRPI